MERYGFERGAEKEEATIDVIRYIINNPIRAGLVERVEDYQFWGSLTDSREELLEYIDKGRLKRWPLRSVDGPRLRSRPPKGGLYILWRA